MYLQESRRTRGGACPLRWSVTAALGSTKVWGIWDDLLGWADNSHARSRHRRKRLRCLCKLLVRSSAIWEGEKRKAATIILANTFLPQCLFPSSHFLLHVWRNWAVRRHLQVSWSERSQIKERFTARSFLFPTHTLHGSDPCLGLGCWEKWQLNIQGCFVPALTLPQCFLAGFGVCFF